MPFSRLPACADASAGRCGKKASCTNAYPASHRLPIAGFDPDNQKSVYYCGMRCLVRPPESCKTVTFHASVKNYGAGDKAKPENQIPYQSAAIRCGHLRARGLPPPPKRADGAANCLIASVGVYASLAPSCQQQATSYNGKRCAQ